MESRRYWFAFWVMILISVVGEVLVLFAAAYIAVTLYVDSTFGFNVLIAILVVFGILFRLGAEIIKKQGLKL